METLAGPISPELVLVDPALRAAILNSIQLRDRRDRFEQHRVDQDERRSWEIAGADESAAAEAVSPLSTLQWWLAVSVYSVIIVVLVLAVFFAARQL